MNLRAADDAIRESNCEEINISGGKDSHPAVDEGLKDRLDLYSLHPSADTSIAPSRALQVAQCSSELCACNVSIRMYLYLSREIQH